MYLNQKFQFTKKKFRLCNWLFIKTKIEHNNNDENILNIFLKKPIVFSNKLNFSGLKLIQRNSIEIFKIIIIFIN